MSLILDGTLGITSPAETVQGALTTTNNTILGDASTDTLNVGNGGLVKDASGNVGIGTASPAATLEVNGELRVYPSTTPANIRFGVSAAEKGKIAVDSSSNMTFETAGTGQMLITAAGLFQFNSGYGSAATAYGCRAWVNFNGTGTVAIRASGNVSSITDNGTGDYTVNLTTALVDANYAAPFSGSRSTSSGASVMCNVTSLTTTTFKVYTTNDTGTLADAEQVQLAVFR